MRKRMGIILLALLVLSALVLSACGESGSADLSDSKYVGTWKAAGVSLGGESEELEDEVIMTLKEDGTGTITSGDETSTFNWKPVDHGFKTSGEMKTTFKEDGDHIKTSILGADLNFEKQ